MTKVSFISEDKMESHASNGGKKAVRETLQDKQMKRYFRSLKRKARKETQNIKSLTDAILPDVQQTSKSVGKLKENLAKNNSSSVNTSKNHVAPTNQMVDTNHQWVQEMNKINRQKSKETFKECKAKDTDKKEESIQLTSTSTEFSPILYWREPIPEVDILDLELPPTSSSNPKVINSSKNFLDQNVWIDKHKFNDAESAYYEKKSKANPNSKQSEMHPIDSSPKTISKSQDMPPSHEIKSKFKTSKKGMKENGRAQNVPEVYPQHVGNMNDEKTLEEYIEMFKEENQEFKENLKILSDVVHQLQLRVDYLEKDPSENLRKFSAETDEGVDLNENPKCIYPTDVLTNVMDSDNTSSSSLNSGSEFEEFVSVKERKNHMSSPVTPWTEDWEDLSNSQDLISILKHHKK